MAWVKYPWHVKHDGVDYKPGEPIEVNDAAGHLLRGAVIIPDQEQLKPAARKRKGAADRAKEED